ncbi:MAG: hypothetical protein ACNA8N_01975 [Trueperaceae bacterium]
MTAVATILALLIGAAVAQGLEREVTIRVGEFYFQVDGQEANAPIELDAVMPYRVTIVNEGSMLHRVKLGRGVVVEEGVPFAYHEILFDAVPLRITGTTAEGATFRIDTTYLTQLDLAPGASIEIAFTLPSTTRGDWEIGCFIPGHYEAGHHAALVVH